MELQLDHSLLVTRRMVIARIAVTSLLLGACVTESVEPDSTDGGKADSPNPTGRPARYPIMLVHGFNASPTRNGFGPEVVSALCADGHSVFAPALPPFASNETRADVLADAIDAALAGGADACGRTPARAPARVNLFAHSMGGLDSRFVVSSLGYGDRVASITTLSTPHRGSAMADMALGLVGSVDSEALASMGELLSRTLQSPTTLEPDLRAAFTSLAEANIGAFNRNNPNDARVHYESWAGLSNVAGVINPQDKTACEGKMSQFSSSTYRHVMHVVLKPIAWVVAHKTDLRPNDGLVQVASAKWGVFRGCVPADHIDEVGALGETSWTVFPHVRFVRSRAFELAAGGF